MNHKVNVELEGTAWATKCHFPAIAGNHVTKSISNSVLELIACLAPGPPLRNLFQKNISPIVRKYLVFSQNVFVPTHFVPLWFRASPACCLRPCSSFPAAQLCAQGAGSGSPALLLGERAQCPPTGSSSGGCPWSRLCPCPLPVNVPEAEVMGMVDVPMSE